MSPRGGHVSEQELQRQAKHRLAVIRHAQEVSGNVAQTCRYYGISRQTYYSWFRRYEEFGLDGLRDRSKRPHVSPGATSHEVVAKIIYLRSNYHFGPQKIEMYLRRYHDITVSVSGIWRILKRLDMNRLPNSQRYKRHRNRWKRYEKPQPGHRVQIDVKFIAPLKGSRRSCYYQFTAIDDCTRVRVLRLYDRLNQKTAIQFLDYALERLPFRVEVIQTDNGSEFQAAFHWHVLDKGIGHVYIKPLRPRLNGKVERSHRIDAEEFYRLLNGVVIDDAEVFNEKLQEWEHFYNYARPHGALGGQTPYERLRRKTTLDVSRPRQSHSWFSGSPVSNRLAIAHRQAADMCSDLRLCRARGGTRTPTSEDTGS
jgi:transposase InsO family protein